MPSPAAHRCIAGLLAIGVTMTLASCTGNDAVPSPSPTPDGTTSATPARATTLLVNRVVPTTGVDMGLEGELGVSDTGCVTINNRFMVAPHGSSLSSDGRAITVPNLGTFTIGGRFNGGGYTRRDVSAPKFRAMLPTDYQTCGDGSFAFINGEF